MEKILKFPKNFLWGVSTSAHQIEGGQDNDWSEWEKSQKRIEALKRAGKDPKDFISGRACDSYNRYEEDASLAKQLHCGAFRIGIEWARIEPEPGKFNLEEIEHYRKNLISIKAKGIKTVATLWHWTSPKWIAKSGGWEEKSTVEVYLRYVEFVARELGEYVDYWITLNEPLVHIGHGYLSGKFPPNKKRDVLSIFDVLSNLIQAHKKAYKIIHEINPAYKVSLTFLTAFVEPARKWCPVEWLLAKVIGHFRNNYFLNRIKGHYDFISLDYYHHDRIVWYPPFIKNENKEVTDFGWEIYPEGIYHVLKNYKKYKKPIFVMENGIADADDDQRPKFILDHLKYVHQALEEGVDVRGYFYWSLLDNFEWADGYYPKFGLFAVDRETFARRARPSAKLYGEICRTNQIIVD